MNENIFARLWTMMHTTTQKLVWLPPLLARLSIGSIFIVTGWGKLTHLDKVIGFFMQLGIPAPRIQAPFVACVEFGCGIAVTLGLLTRVTALPLIGVMVVAIITAKWAQLGGVLDLFGTEEFLLIVLLYWLHIAGPGSISLDQLLLKDRK